MRKQQANWKNIDAQTFQSQVGNTVSTNMPTTLRDSESMLSRCRNEGAKSTVIRQQLLSRSHAILAKMLHDRLQPLLATEQSMDQIGLRRGTGKPPASCIYACLRKNHSNRIPTSGLQAWTWQRPLLVLRTTDNLKHWRSNMFRNLTLICWKRKLLRAVASWATFEPWLLCSWLEWCQC